MKFSRRTFLPADIYGLLVLLPQYFLEAKNGRDYLPPITHPEYYFGFIGVTVAWQEDILHLYSLPLDEQRPVVCFDKLPVQLIDKVVARAIAAQITLTTIRRQAVTHQSFALAMLTLKSNSDHC